MNRMDAGVSNTVRVASRDDRLPKNTKSNEDERAYSQKITGASCEKVSLGVGHRGDYSPHFQPLRFRYGLLQYGLHPSIEHACQLLPHPEKRHVRDRCKSFR